MAVWTDCQGGPSFYGGWACDMGVWAGAWPLQPPTRMDGLDPATNDEIDYVVGLPNTAHPGDAFYGLDGSYDAQVWDAFRSLNDTPPPDSFGDYFVSSVGSATDPGPTDTPPVGAHLYVVAYAGSFGSFTEPPNPPEFYVPATYATGGSAPEPGGHWSDWQDGVILTADFSSTDGTNWADYNDTESTNTDSDPTVQLQAALTTILAAATAHSGTGGTMFSPAATKFPGDGISDPLSQGRIIMNQLSINYAGTANNPSVPAPLAALTEGVDYDVIPFDDGAVAQFESTDPASFAWPDTMVISAGGGAYTTDGDATGMTVPTTDIRVDVLDAPIALTTAGIVAGTQIGTVSVAADDEPWAGVLGNPYTIDLPSDLGLSFTLAAAPAMAYSGTYDDTAGGDFGGGGADGGWGWTATFVWDNGDGNALTLTWTTSRWRYWIPLATPGIFWHTVGGHFGTVGGATLRILTPLPTGLTPVDVVDGPA